MSGLFDNFTHVNTAMRPANVTQKYPSINKPQAPFEVPNPNKPFENRAMDGTLKGYFWYAGNSVELVFDVSGTIVLDNGYYMNSAEVLEGLLITFSIFDHRHASVIQFTNYGAGQPLEYTLTHNDVGEVSGKIIISIDHEDSQKLPKGVYTCQLTVSHPSGYYETLFDTSTCTFEVR